MRSIVALFASVVFTAFVTVRADARALPAPLAQLQQTIRNAAASAPGFAALEVRDLATGYTSGYNMNAVMPAASTIKIPIMVEVFEQMAAGKFDLNRRVELLPGDRDWGSGTICESPAGSTFAVSTLLTQMITVSDNTAANMLIRLVGRSHINATMRDLGLHHTHLADYIRTAAWSVRTDLRTTPSDMVKLLGEMAQNQLIDPWSSRQMIAILEHQEINTLLPEPLPDIPIAHKTGSFDDTLNDVGIVFGTEPYIIAVLTTDLPSLDSGRSFIHRISRVAYTRMQQFGHWRVENGVEDASGDIGTSAVTAPAAQPQDAAPVAEDVPMWGTATPAPGPAATP